MTRFGPAGNSDSYDTKKGNLGIPDYLKRFRLNAYEYQCGRGVKISEENARKFGKIAKESDIAISLHSPYYISLSSAEEEKRLKSLDYILQSARAVDYMGGTRVVVHSGSASKMDRREALELSKDTLKRAMSVLDENDLSHIVLCPEVMGKINQLGTLEEVMELCSVDERFLPCVDFGHLNARTFGGLSSREDFEKVFRTIENSLGYERMKNLHVHFSKIEYTEKGGEKRHLTFEDTIYGPFFEPLAEIIVKKRCTPTIICESRGTQAEDAMAMRVMYEGVLDIVGDV